ncbi:MAG TPA: sugar phosphate isomerase/epimerase family protein [Verrucomicrobiota bacterium]|nr:sugar phosphate isomerase/epimerase family protein [Verrucomicrobiota bacterium]HNU51805.1 sugar phosphate isomerase/epimerase family protein [Verrucomicrobiota bacterium]
MSTSIAERLGVCSWSLQPVSAEDLFEKLAATGILRVSIALDPIRENAGGAWSDFKARAAQRGVTCVSGMMTTIGEDYTTLESIKRTGGVVPDRHWEGNWRNFQANADLAVGLGLKFVMFHAGFLPHEESDPAFPKLRDRLTRVADLFAARGIAVGFETGQETAETLRAFLRQLNRPNVGINFDPANMLLYDKGDPIAALRTLGPWLRQCHMKDAVRTRVPGTWGEEVVVGTGQVDWPAFMGVLRELKFEGDLCLEREAGTQRVADLRAGAEFLKRLPA